MAKLSKEERKALIEKAEEDRAKNPKPESKNLVLLQSMQMQRSWKTKTSLLTWVLT